MPKKYKGKYLQIYFPPEELPLLEEFRKKCGKQMSEIVRKLIRQYLKKEFNIDIIKDQQVIHVNVTNPLAPPPFFDFISAYSLETGLDFAIAIISKCINSLKRGHWRNVNVELYKALEKLKQLREIVSVMKNKTMLRVV